MTITATQVLEMLAKATQLGISYQVYADEEYGHCIQFPVDWYADEYNTYSYEKVYITGENEETWYGGWVFSAFMDMLDVKLSEQKQEEIKKQKRQELIARLTDEEKELLNLRRKFSSLLPKTGSLNTKHLGDSNENKVSHYF